MPRPMYAKSGGKWWQVYPTPPVVVAPVLTATGGNAQVVLTWTAATGTTVLSYEVEKDGVVENVGNVLTKTYTGLTNGQAYSFKVRAVVNYVSSPWSNTASATPVAPFNAATGGATTDVPNYNGTGQTWRVHDFTTGGTLTVTAAINPFTYLIVGGGGASGNGEPGGGTGGGGGGGGVVQGSTALSVAAYPVVVGAGGASPSADGGSSAITGVASAAGGGGGGDWWSSGRSGGCGGGGGGQHGGNGGAGTAGQGYAGGPGDSGPGGGKGGCGGGAGGVGGDAWQTGGGAPLSSNITGSALTFANGGGPATSPRAGHGDGGGNGTTAAVAGSGGRVIVAYRIA